ncbi:IclR family transcriptional regulator [Geodermatophilus sabuli]|uniref:IclR family transcriptional regulator n=1 Tax=Geodermatophilus sabuli TaxID=1564158 RepID=A0A7K3VVS3_9ACTN|nr:IclR family transcriptional regulator [Geodermatophilus sabuli]NEK56735.1 IclR family transcriptional regulator [Geodermatophilus sabuli]
MTPSEPPVRRGRRPPHGDPVLDRGLALLGAFDRDHPRLTLLDLSRRSGIPKSSAARLAGRLVGWGALERDEQGRFTVGLRLLGVASLAPRGQGLREIALPFMGDLAEAVHQHVLLVVRDGEHGVLVDRISSHRALTPLYHTGDRLPLHSTGGGLVLLAYAPWEVQEALLARDLVQEPEMLPISSAALRRTLAAVRRNRVAVFRRDEPVPLVSVAAPIVASADRVIAALSVVVPEQRTDARRLSGAVMTAAGGISRVLSERGHAG